MKVRDLVAGMNEGKDDGIDSVVKALSDVQRKMSTVQDEAAKKVEELWAESADLEKKLRVTLKSKGVTGEELIRLFVKYKIDVGNGLDSRFADEIERASGKRPYPESYKPQWVSKWALVER
jgi:uncharacterized Zn finger protein